MRLVPTHANEGLRALHMADMPDWFNFLLRPAKPLLSIRFLGLSSWKAPAGLQGADSVTQQHQERCKGPVTNPEGWQSPWPSDWESQEANQDGILNRPHSSTHHILFLKVCLVSYYIFMLDFMNISSRKLILNLFCSCLFFQEMYVCKLPLIYVNTEAEEFHFIVTN